MADFILHRKISVYTYPFPEGAFQIYGGGKFYNGFSIGDSINLSVVNRDGVLNFSRVASNPRLSSVILGTIPKNNKNSIYMDIASPLSQSMDTYFEIGNGFLYTKDNWTTAKITYTQVKSQNLDTLRHGGVLTIAFRATSDLPAIPNLFAVRALWLGSE